MSKILADILGKKWADFVVCDLRSTVYVLKASAVKLAAFEKIYLSQKCKITPGPLAFLNFTVVPWEMA